MMEPYFAQQLVYGKLILNGEDISGFDVVGNSPELSDNDCKEIIKQTFSGQIGDLENLNAVFGLTETDVSGRRVFFGIFKSKIIDKARGAFPIKHSVTLNNIVVTNLGIVSLARKLNEQSINRQFTQKETLTCLALEYIESSEEIDAVEICFSDYSNSILQVIDALFLYNSVVVVTDNLDPFFRLYIISTIYKLLPPSLQSKFSFNTNVYDPINQAKFHVKFISPRPTESDSNSLRVLLKRNSTINSDIKTQFAIYLRELLLQNAVSFKKVVQHCQNITVDLDFSKDDSLYLSKELKNSLQPELFISRINSGATINAIEVLDLVSRQGISIKDEDLEILCRYILLSALQQGQYDLVKSFHSFIYKLPASFWCDIAEEIIKQNNTASVLSFFEASGGQLLNIINSNYETFVSSWIDNIIDTGPAVSLLPIVHSNIIIDHIKKDTLVRILNCVFCSNPLELSLLESFLDLLQKREDSTDLLQQCITGLSSELTKSYPMLSKLLSSIASQSNLPLEQIEPSINNLKQEMLNNPKLIMHLGVLGLRARQIYPVSPAFLEFIITQESFSQIFASELSKMDLTPLLLTIHQEYLGALIAFSLINAPTVIDDISLQSNFEKWTTESKNLFIAAFVRIASKVRDCIKYYMKLSQYLERNAKYQALILIAENVQESQIRSDIIREVITLFEESLSKLDDIETWGSKLINLSKTASTIMSNNVYRLCLQSYICSTGDKFIDGLDFIISKQCSYEDLYQIVKGVSTRNCFSDEQNARLWYDLFIFVQSRDKVIPQNCTYELLKQQTLSLLSDAELETLIGIQGLNRVDTPAYKESLRRSLYSSSSVFIARISTDIKNGKIDVKGLSTLLRDVWKPGNFNEVLDMLSCLENIGLSELAEEIVLDYVRQDSGNISMKLLEVEFKKLEQRAHVFWQLANVLSLNTKAIEVQQVQIKALAKNIDNFMKNSELNDARKKLDKACNSDNIITKIFNR